MPDTKKTWTSPELESLDKNANDVEAGISINYDGTGADASSDS